MADCRGWGVATMTRMNPGLYPLALTATATPDPMHYFSNR